MARRFGRSRPGILVAVTLCSVAGFAHPVGANPPAHPHPGLVVHPGPVARTPLPPGWELCVLQGVGAPGTPDNVADLDAWQMAEGGSTDNAAAYNPFNTRLMSDAKGRALPGAVVAGGFPAFTTWAAGCSATVATLLQANMAPIVAALTSGTVAPSGAFLSDVDQTPWCAPSADGVPCYASEILAGQLLGSLLGGHSGQLTATLTSYADTGSDLRDYEQDVMVVTADQAALTAKEGELAQAQQALAAARGTLSDVTDALRRLALHVYTDGSMMRADTDLSLLGPQDESGVVAQYLGNVAASVVVTQYQQARSGLTGALSGEQAAAVSAGQATQTLDAATAAESQTLSTLQTDVTGIETGLSCAAPAVTTTAAPPVVPTSAGQLWTALQHCLAPTTTPATPAATPPPS